MSRFVRLPESWPRKFRLAFSGMLHAFIRQRSFWVHLPMAVAVIVGATLHEVSRVEWAVLIVCITIVLAAELFNTALEYLAQAITDQHSEPIRRALDVASGAVLVTAIGAAAVGSLILLTRLAQALQD
jgi:diacylglycerol kinase